MEKARLKKTEIEEIILEDNEMSETLTKEMYEVSYEQLDKNIVGLVKFLNEFDGINTTGSCGGHANNKHYQLPENEWSVTFSVEFNQTEVSTEGWCALEFLVWACNSNLIRNGYNVNISTHSAPPYLNSPGSTIYFALKGKDVSADVIVDELKELKKDSFISFEDYQNDFDEDFDDDDE